MTIDIDVEDGLWGRIPELEGLTQRAAAAAFDAAGFDGSNHVVTILFTDDDAMKALNTEWRGKASPTNVLSFLAPDDLPIPSGEDRPLGDIVLASGVVAREASEQGKSLPDHVAHLIVHGILHLLGHDHEDDDEADRMEHLETEILKGLGISDPYERK